MKVARPVLAGGDKGNGLYRALSLPDFDAPGTLAKVDGELVFFGDNGDITTVEPSMINFLTVLGEVGLANARQIVDRLEGGYAQIACDRQMGLF